MKLFDVGITTNADIIEQLEKVAKFVDTDLVKEWRAGISFLYDFGFISLAQWGIYYNKFEN